MMRNSDRNTAFTLIELLVVIAIIGVLATLLSSSTIKAMESARVIKCASNLKSLGLAAQLYTMDHDGYLPAYADAGVTWDSQLLPYLGEAADVLACPSDPWPDAAPEGESIRTYAVNGGQKWLNISQYPNYPFGGFDGQPPLPLADVEGRSGAVILISERPGLSPLNRGLVGGYPFCTLDQAPGRVHRNGEGSNYLFADLSAAYLLLEEADISDEHDFWYVR